jgi:succinate dehydrogenase flavin-adding protein (antitoxin of CptAB toxin-antitoxin module)
MFILRPPTLRFLSRRLLSTTTPLLRSPKDAKTNDPNELATAGFPPNTDSYRASQLRKPLNPTSTNTTSSAPRSVPQVGAANVPPDLISSADQDSATTTTSSSRGPGLAGSFGDVDQELGVGEITSGQFRVEPLRRVGEDLKTMRARLIYQSRKRGILETDLLLSTFAHENLERMDRDMLDQYDRFLDENDWDIYYWATQQAPPTSVEYAEGGSSPPGGGADAGVRGAATEEARPSAAIEQRKGNTEQGKGEVAGVTEFGGQAPTEWAQTVGKNREPYRPPPRRWKDSEILKMIRRHVEVRKGREGGVQGEVGGLGRMPDFK